jgi:hypothetical protein
MNRLALYAVASLGNYLPHTRTSARVPMWYAAHGHQRHYTRVAKRSGLPCSTWGMKRLAWYVVASLGNYLPHTRTSATRKPMWCLPHTRTSATRIDFPDSWRILVWVTNSDKSKLK